MVTGNDTLAKEAIQEKDIVILEGILEDEGFTTKIDPLEVNGAQWWVNNLKYGNKPPKRDYFRKPLDDTDYITPYTRGFLRSNEKGLITGYGVLDEVCIERQRLAITPANHFFYITKDLTKPKFIQ